MRRSGQDLKLREESNDRRIYGLWTEEEDGGKEVRSRGTALEGSFPLLDGPSVYMQNLANCILTCCVVSKPCSISTMHRSQTLWNKLYRFHLSIY